MIAFVGGAGYHVGYVRGDKRRVLVIIVTDRGEIRDGGAAAAENAVSDINNWRARPIVDIAEKPADERLIILFSRVDKAAREFGVADGDRAAAAGFQNNTGEIDGACNDVGGNQHVGNAALSVCVYGKSRAWGTFCNNSTGQRQILNDGVLNSRK